MIGFYFLDVPTGNPRIPQFPGVISAGCGPGEPLSCSDSFNHAPANFSGVEAENRFIICSFLMSLFIFKDLGFPF